MVRTLVVHRQYCSVSSKIVYLHSQRASCWQCQLGRTVSTLLYSEKCPRGAFIIAFLLLSERAFSIAVLEKAISCCRIGKKLSSLNSSTSPPHQRHDYCPLRQNGRCPSPSSAEGSHFCAPHHCRRPFNRCTMHARRSLRRCDLPPSLLRYYRSAGANGGPSGN